VIDGLRVIWRGLNSVRIQGYSYIWANLAFFFLCLPVVTMPAAVSALFRVGYVAHTEPHDSDLSLFWDTFRENLWRALPWGLAHAAFAIVNFTNLLSYADTPGLLAGGLRLVWIGSGMVWLGIVLYTWPIYYAMENPSLLQATRNAFIMVVRNPFFTVIILAGLLLLAVISTILVAAWVLLTWGTISAIANAAVLDRLSVFRDSSVKEYGIH
jgi:uncharacterized membrane protein YesL